MVLSGKVVVDEDVVVTVVSVDWNCVVVGAGTVVGGTVTGEVDDVVETAVVVVSSTVVVGASVVVVG